MTPTCEVMIYDDSSPDYGLYPRCGKKAMWVYSDEVLEQFYYCNDCREKLIREFGPEFHPKMEPINPKLRCLT